MLITKIEKINTKRSRIYSDEGLLFVLYAGEIRKYKIRENEDLPESIYEEIVTNVLAKRAKLRAMELLKKMDRTEAQLRQKLNEGGYPKNVIDDAIEYVRGYHYIDDVRYAEGYTNWKKATRSRRQISRELYQKGVDRETIANALESYSDEDERDGILGWMRKKGFDPEVADMEQKRKMYGFLIRKGFRAGDVLSCMKMSAFD